MTSRAPILTLLVATIGLFGCQPEASGTEQTPAPKAAAVVESANSDPGPVDAIASAKGAIQVNPATGMRRLAMLATWLNRKDVAKCSTHMELIPSIRVVSPTKDSFPHIQVSKEDTETSAKGFEFLYDLTTAKRLCQPIDSHDGTSPIIVKGPSAIAKWWMDNHDMPDSITPTFPVDSRFGAADWVPLKPTLKFEFQRRHTKPPYVTSETVQIFIPMCIREKETCPNPPEPVPANQVSIDEFYWVQLGTEDYFENLNAGEFIILKDFHLVEKRMVNGAPEWLWSTFWWENNRSEMSEFPAPKPLHEAGDKTAGNNPFAWNNYSMDATYSCNRVVFNPSREQDPKSNCSQCHREARISGHGTGDVGTGLCTQTPPPVKGSLDNVFMGELYSPGH